MKGFNLPFSMINTFSGVSLQGTIGMGPREGVLFSEVILWEVVSFVQRLSSFHSTTRPPHPIIPAQNHSIVDIPNEFSISILSGLLEVVLLGI